ncbi:MAG TPA: hypothetical protein VNK49_01445 [Anaerolineales bacterium]|nr:hypothetical protein [Anaerolineales bacterium]
MPKTITAGTSPKIILHSINGDLSIVGWESMDILVKGDEDEVHLEQHEEEVLLSCEGDLSLRVPKAASFQIKTIGGDASVRGVTGNIEIKEVHGDLSIRDAGSISVGAVHADFSLRGAKGNLYVKSAYGDVSIRDVEGDVVLDSVADDLALRGGRGNIKVNVGEDVVVYLDPKPDGEYSITAGDDILLVLKPDANATLTMQGDQIVVDWPGVKKEEEVTERTIVLGNGSARITLQAGGDVRVTNKADAGYSADEFGNFAGLDFDWSGFGERISRQVEQATARAAKHAEEAARRAARYARHAAHSGRGFVFDWNIGAKGASPAPQSSSEPVTEEERLMILKMLQEKKITAEEAERLFSALEGGK